MPRIGDNGFDLDIARLRINLRADGGNPAVEFFIGVCVGDGDNNLPGGNAGKFLLWQVEINVNRIELL